MDAYNASDNASDNALLERGSVHTALGECLLNLMYVSVIIDIN